MSSTHQKRPQMAPTGYVQDFHGSSDGDRPWTFQAYRMRRCDRQIMPQPKRVRREVRLENQVKTSAPLLLTFR